MRKNILLDLIIISICFSLISSEYKLKFVTEIFRHGARYPLGEIFDYQQWPNYESNKGELTAVGMRQQYLLGNYIRQHYINNLKFLTQNFNQSLFFARSDDCNRTFESVQSQMYGIYPLGTGPQIPFNYPFDRAVPPNKQAQIILNSYQALPNLFQPIPVHTNDEKPAYLIDGNDDHICPYLKYLKKQQFQSLLYQQMQTYFNETFIELTQMLNQEGYLDQKITSIYDVEGLMSNLECNFQENRPLLTMSQELQRKVHFIRAFTGYFMESGLKIQQQVEATPFFKELIELFDNSLLNSRPLKMALFSGHDSTLIYLTSSLNISSAECIYDLFFKNQTNSLNCYSSFPVFASNLFIELYVDEEVQENDPYVMIMYNGEYVKLCEKDSITCNWNQFRARLENFILPNYDQICNQTLIEF